MKKILFLIALCILWSCEIDTSFDDENNDSDDINLIDKVWKQSLDKAIEVYDTKTKAS